SGATATAQNRAQVRVEARQGEANSQLTMTRYQSGNCLLSEVPIQPSIVYDAVQCACYWSVLADGIAPMDLIVSWDFSLIN
ncbi:MAG: hypothetical protein AAFX95_27905, partial [Cyanobacteria bacterium J06639_16]